MTRGAERVLLLGLGALLMQAVAIVTSLLLFRVNPVTKQPSRR